MVSRYLSNGSSDRRDRIARRERSHDDRPARGEEVHASQRAKRPCGAHRPAVNNDRNQDQIVDAARQQPVPSARQEFAIGMVPPRGSPLPSQLSELYAKAPRPMQGRALSRFMVVE